jgi:transcriptional regulator with XRE-family HTH domain
LEIKKDVFCPVKIQQMKSVGETLRGLRNRRHLLIREVAASVKMDQTLLSKIERDERLPTEEQLKAFMRFYKQEGNDIMLAYLSDRVLAELADQPLALEAIHLAEQKIQLSKVNKRK